MASAATHDRRANSLSSPPKTSVPPATIKAISEMDSATGPGQGLRNPVERRLPRETAATSACKSGRRGQAVERRPEASWCGIGIVETSLTPFEVCFRRTRPCTDRSRTR